MTDVQALYIALSGVDKVSSCIDELPKLEKISVDGVRCWPWSLFPQVICLLFSCYSCTSPLLLSSRICH